MLSSNDVMSRLFADSDSEGEYIPLEDDGLSFSEDACPCASAHKERTYMQIYVHI